MRASQHTIMRNKSHLKGLYSDWHTVKSDSKARRRKPPRRAWRSRLQLNLHDENPSDQQHITLRNHGIHEHRQGVVAQCTKHTQSGDFLVHLLFKGADLTVNLASRFMGHSVQRESLRRLAVTFGRCGGCLVQLRTVAQRRERDASHFRDTGPS